MTLGLVDAATRIGEVVTLMQYIAEQTHMLACDAGKFLIRGT